jgi:hypothetical protein
MDFFTPDFFSALLAIIVIDLVLAGDNAIVIAMAARNLPAHLQKKAIIWGAVGAIAVRSAMTLVVVYLLKVPGLMLVGGVLLIWIAYRLLNPAKEEGDDHDVATTSFWTAMKTIVIADAVMVEGNANVPLKTVVPFKFVVVPVEPILIGPVEPPPILTGPVLAVLVPIFNVPVVIESQRLRVPDAEADPLLIELF